MHLTSFLSPRPKKSLIWCIVSQMEDVATPAITVLSWVGETDVVRMVKFVSKSTAITSSTASSSFVWCRSWDVKELDWFIGAMYLKIDRLFLLGLSRISGK